MSLKRLGQKVHSPYEVTDLNKEVEDIIIQFCEQDCSVFSAYFFTVYIMAYKNKFAHKQEMIQKRESIEAIVTWISNIKL